MMHLWAHFQFEASGKGRPLEGAKVGAKIVARLSSVDIRQMWHCSRININAPEHTDVILVLEGDHGDWRYDRAAALLKQGYAHRLVLDADGCSRNRSRLQQPAGAVIPRAGQNRRPGVAEVSVVELGGAVAKARLRLDAFSACPAIWSETSGMHNS